jgi:hypothetical protein
MRFCILYDLLPCPASEQTLLYYISYLFSQNIKATTTRVYLSAIRNIHVTNGIQYIGLTPKIQMALKGSHVLSSPPKRMKPITYSLLATLLTLVRQRRDSLMLEAALTMGFFGCLRSGEFCLPDREIFNPKTHLCVRDVTLDPLNDFTHCISRSLRQIPTATV